MTRKWEILDSKNKDCLMGYLYLDVEAKEYKLEVLEDYTNKYPDEFMLYCIRNKIKYLTGDLMDKWIKQRVCPPERQLLQETLKCLGIPYYDIQLILDYTKGYSVMDDFYFKEQL